MTILFQHGLLVYLAAIGLKQVVATKDPSQVVTTQSGAVRGVLSHTTFDDIPFYSFKGIPYANSITQKRRFLPPLPVDAWTEIKDCSKFGNVCLQYDDNDAVVGSEDCLFLNVYSPAKKSTEMRSVMVFIHGGDWTRGSGNDDFYGPDFLIEEDVLLVTLNYRLGLLGFMSLGTEEYSGNQGLKDQQLALKWISQNIASFGGNDKKITIFGQGSGSASCELHRMASGSDELFYQSIEMSGAYDVISMFRKDFNYNVRTQNNDAFISGLQKLDSVAILKAVPQQTLVKPKVDSIKSYWYPVAETFQAKQPFINFTPTARIMMSNFTTYANVMTGYTSSEALSFDINDIKTALQLLDSHFVVDFPSENFYMNYTSPMYSEAAARIKQFYFPSGIDDSQRNLDSFIQMLSNVQQNYQIDSRVKVLAQQSFGITYYYRFAMDWVLNYFKITSGGRAQIGAAHGDDLCYVFKCKFMSDASNKILVGSKEHGLIKRMTNLYASFAKISDPGFPDAQVNQIKYLDITNDGDNVGENPLNETFKFWYSLMGDFPELINYRAHSNVNKLVRQILKQYV